MPASLFDTNIWIAAVFSSHPHHNKARQVLQEAIPASPAVFCRSTQQSFLRLASTPAILNAYGAESMTNRSALAAMNALLALRQVSCREEPPGTTDLWRQLATCDTASPKVWMDAYLAAFAMRGGLRMVTLDRDFAQFRARGLDLLLLATT